MQTYGLLQPIVVRRAGRKFELVAGHRRLEAARQLGWQTIDAVVRTASEGDAYLLTLIENLQREDLSPREEADALTALVRERAWSTRQVASAIHRSQAFVSKRLRVFEDKMLAPAVLDGHLTISAAEELLAVPERDRYDLLARAIDGGWDFAQLRAAISERFDSNHPSGRRRPGLSRRVQDLRKELRDVQPEKLTELDRAELRRLFNELVLLARAAPSTGRHPVFPPLPVSRVARSRARGA
jgi:ParB family chromosome partitioning protein